MWLSIVGSGGILTVVPRPARSGSCWAMARPSSMVRYRKPIRSVRASLRKPRRPSNIVGVASSSRSGRTARLTDRFRHHAHLSLIARNTSTAAPIGFGMRRCCVSGIDVKWSRPAHMRISFSNEHILVGVARMLPSTYRGTLPAQSGTEWRPAGRGCDYHGAVFCVDVCHHGNDPGVFLRRKALETAVARFRAPDLHQDRRKEAKLDRGWLQRSCLRQREI